MVIASSWWSVEIYNFLIGCPFRGEHGNPCLFKNEEYQTKNMTNSIKQQSYKPLSRCGHLDFTQFQLIVTKTEAGQNTSLAPCAMLAFIIVIGNREHDQNSDSVIGLYILQLKSKGTTGVHVIGTLMYCEIWTFIVSTICWI